ncbi:hypothetical protein TB1_031835 [Malus domestica]
MLIEIEIEIREGEGERETEKEGKGRVGISAPLLQILDLLRSHLHVLLRLSQSQHHSPTHSLTHSLTTGHTGTPTPQFFGETSPHNHHHSLRSAQDTHVKAFHCAVATATVHRLLLRDLPLPTSREKVVARAVGKKKVFSCLCPSNL